MASFDWLLLSLVGARVSVCSGLRLIEDRKKVYRSDGAPHFPPWIFLATDGLPTDDVTGVFKAVREVRSCEIRKSLQPAKLRLFPARG